MRQGALHEVAEKLARHMASIDAAGGGPEGE
jgi:hypothetical protein